MTAEIPDVHARRPHVNFWLVAVIVLAAGLVALGAWALVDRSAGSDTEATQIVDDLNTAVSAGNAEAIRELYARDAVFTMPDGQAVTGLDNIVNATLIPHGVGFQVERVAPVSAEGDFAATFIRYANGSEGVELLVLQLEDGKIVRQWVYLHG